MIYLGRLGTALLSAALLGTYALFPSLAFLAFFALVPWIVLYTDPREGRISSIYFVVAALATWVLNYNATIQYGWYVPLIMGLVLFVFWLPFAPVLRRIHHHYLLPRSLTVPMVWVTMEWLRANLTMSHFELFLLGYSQARFPALIQIAEITGIYGVSFLLAACNGWIADFWFELREGGWSLATAVRRRRIWAGAVVIGLGFAGVALYGSVRLRTIQVDPGPRLAIVQPNVKHTMRNIFGVQLTQLYITDRGLQAGDADLIVWPENAILDYVDRKVYLDDLEWLAKRKDAMILLGAMGQAPGRPGRTTNSAFLLDREARILHSYSKQVLFPWTEYVPGDDFLGRWLPAVQRFQRKLNRVAWGFVPAGVAGTETTLFELPWNDETLKFATLICFENGTPVIPAEAARKGARFFVNITSEGAAGGPIQEQLLRVAIFRAVENRMAYVRAGNDGISGFIDPRGTVVSMLRDPRGLTVNVPGVHTDHVPLYRGGKTFYAVSRDALVKGVIAVTTLLFLVTFLRRRGGATAAAMAAVLILVLGGCSGGLQFGTDPGDVDSALQEGRRLFADGRHADALPLFAKACATAEGCRLALDHASDSFDGTGKYEDAVLFFDAVASKYPELEARALGHLGLFQSRTLTPDLAENSYRRSLDLEPSALVHARLGALLLEMRDIESALESMERGLELEPDNVQLIYMYGRALRLQGAYDRSLQVLGDLVATYPGHGSAWANLGRVRLLQGDREGAVRALRQSLRVEPTNTEALFTLGRMALRKGEYGQAEAIILRLRKIEASLGRGRRME